MIDLVRELRKYVADNHLIMLVEQFLKAEILDGLEHWTPTGSAPQGAIISPLLSNLYLNDLDHHMADAGYEMTRYADDLVIQSRTREEADTALVLVAAWTAERGLTLHPDQDQNRPRGRARLRIPWLSLSQASPLSAVEELGEIQGCHSRQDHA